MHIIFLINVQHYAPLKSCDLLWHVGIHTILYPLFNFKIDLPHLFEYIRSAFVPKEQVYRQATKRKRDQVLMLTKL